MTIKIPKKLYVTYQRRAEDEPRLAFASPYEKNSGFEKRRHTQDKWAYGTTIEFKIEDDETVVCTKGDASKHFMMKCYPEIIDNPPLEGFTISKTVTHGGDWNRTNTVWRIRDPRDFELEISSANLGNLLRFTTVQNGDILGKCCWGRDGSKNLLLPENSEPFKDAQQVTKRLVNTIRLKDIKPGSKVTLINNKLKNTYTFVGEFYFLGTDDCWQTKRPRKEHVHIRDLRTVKKPIYMNDNGNFFSIGSKIKDVVPGDDNYDVEKMLDKVVDVLNLPGEIDGLFTWVFAASTKPINVDEIKINFEDTTKDSEVKHTRMSEKSRFVWPQTRNFICKLGQDDFIFSDSHNKGNWRSKNPDQFNFYWIHLPKLLNGYLAGVEGQYVSQNSLDVATDPKVITYSYQNRTISLHYFPMWLFNCERDK